MYRLYDANGGLLYIGASYDPDRRLDDHKRKPWGAAITRQTVRWYPSRDEALDEESRAIEAERPPHNQAGTPKYAERRRAEMAATPGKWRVAYDANQMRLQVARQLRRFGYSLDRAEGEGMIVERAYKELSGVYPNGVSYPALDMIERWLARDAG